MIPSLFPTWKQILTLKVVFMELIICHESLVTSNIAIYASNFKLVSVRIITPRSAHCEQSCRDKPAAARRGMPRARGRQTVWKRLARYCSRGTKVAQLNTTACWLSRKTTCSLYTLFKHSPSLCEKNGWPWNAIRVHPTESLQCS